MRRIALAVLAAALSASPAQAADRTDPVPASVGPQDFRSYFVNHTANLPAGVTSERWRAVAERVMKRWGATYLGTTTASPDDHEDGLDVIGFSTQLPASVAGRNSKSKGGMLVTPGASTTCSVAPNMGTTQSVSTVQTPLRLRVRSDRVRRGKVRRRTLTVTRTLTAPRIDSAPAGGQRCVDVSPGTESDPATVEHESDIQMDSTPGAQWYAGPDLPPDHQLDLETVLLHELGHAAGLGHQPQDCDPSTPMRPSTASGEYWRGLDQVRYEDCPAFAATPDPPHGTEAPFPGGSLAGRTFLVNPAVPAGYDGERFKAAVQRAVERWGGVLAGTTDKAPTQGDGLSVIGFDTIARTDYEVTTRTTNERLLFPAYRTCAIVTGQVPSFRVKKVTKRVKVRVRGRRKKLKVRRDRVVRTSVGGPATGQCTDHAAEARQGATTVETDIGIAHEMDAYEMGPAHPVLLTRVDMPTLLASALGRAAGIAPADRCSRTTPVTLPLKPGDWWHAPEDVNRVECAAGRAAAARPAADGGPTSGRVRYVQIQD